MKTHVSELSQFPVEYQKDIKQAIEILKAGGCREIHLFGSLAEGRSRRDSDIDIGVRGCPPQHFFPLLGKLLMQLNHPVDLINLDNKTHLSSFLEKHGLLVHVG